MEAKKTERICIKCLNGIRKGLNRPETERRKLTKRKRDGIERETGKTEERIKEKRVEKEMNWDTKNKGLIHIKRTKGNTERKRESVRKEERNVKQRIMVNVDSVCN